MSGIELTGVGEEESHQELKATIKYLGTVEFPSSDLVPERVVKATISGTGVRKKVVYFTIPEGQTVEKLMMSRNGRKRIFVVITNLGLRVPQARGLGRNRRTPIQYDPRKFHTNIRLVRNA